jgi:hypothetical protein
MVALWLAGPSVHTVSMDAFVASWPETPVVENMDAEWKTFCGIGDSGVSLNTKQYSNEKTYHCRTNINRKPLHCAIWNQTICEHQS